MMPKFFDSDGFEIKEGCRLVWSSLLGEQSTGIVFLDGSVLCVRLSLIKTLLLSDIVRYEAWCLVVPAYPKELLHRVA